MYPRVYFMVFLILVSAVTATSGNIDISILHVNSLRISGKFCPPLRSSSTIITCVLRGEGVACNSNVKPGTIANVKCKRYYKPISQPDYSRLICLENGEWNHRLFDCVPECGISNLAHAIGDTNVESGTFPWHAGLYYRESNDGVDTWENKCSGTLITDQFVITVTNCVVDNEENDIRVALGKKYRDWDKAEKGETKFAVSTIIRQHEFCEKINSYDMALLRLRKKVEYGENIMPVCHGFPGGSSNLKDTNLYVVAWGKEGDITSANNNTVLHNRIVVVNQDDCRNNGHYDFPTFKKICRMTKNHTLSELSLVQSDGSGGGATAVYNGLHFILGLVNSKCNEYSIHTQLTFPNNVLWIENELKKYDSNFIWGDNTFTEPAESDRGCLLPEASSSRKFCSLDEGCEDCNTHDNRSSCFIPPGSKVERVRVVCAPGFTLRNPHSGGDVATCMNGQSWYPIIPECHRFKYIPGDPWNQVTWQEARNNCMNKGSLLATIKSEDEEKIFKEAVAKHFNTTGIPPCSVWIGLTDARLEGTFEWVDGSVLSGRDFSKWIPGEPSDHDKLEHCVEAYVGCSGKGYLYHWNDNYCSDLQYYFCKEIIFSDSTAPRISGVFRNKVSSGSPRYKYFPGNPWSKVTWEEARHNCLTKGSQLAIIRNEDQQKLFEEAVTKQFEDTGTSPNSIWIGLSQMKNTNVRLFEWEDGSIHNGWRSCAFSKWLNKVPVLDLSRNCAEALVGNSEISPDRTVYQWNDTDCTMGKYYFCSVKL